MTPAVKVRHSVRAVPERSHNPKSAKSSFLLPNRFTFLLVLLALSVRTVTALGIRRARADFISPRSIAAACFTLARNSLNNFGFMTFSTVLHVGQS